ncbi:hypothetical protein G7Y89_g13958 [Cudoniella acicularis]|uniref:Uncharacterized protein n=1 Tax=Cudoniella acicularis TaxID=354080 RepID=A0A8H4R694_9HELO|nr:hypothetical protein G7Y89_g13958 [Cudoniella acicularis]
MSTSPISHSPSLRRTESPTSNGSNSNSNSNSSASSTPVLPLTLSFPSPDGFLGSPRLDPIIEHVVAEHTPRPTQHERTASITSISFKSSRNGSPSPIGQPKATTPSRIRDASPPPPA